jgi:hypothetical protein
MAAMWIADALRQVAGLTVSLVVRLARPGITLEPEGLDLLGIVLRVPPVVLALSVPTGFAAGGSARAQAAANDRVTATVSVLNMGRLLSAVFL